MAGRPPNRKKVGILALQGDVSLHVQALRAFGLQPTLVKKATQLKGLDGLIIPGGESTALLRLAEPISMLPAIKAFARSGAAILGICAGAILLASKVTNPAQQSLGLIDITIKRNGYGRQINSAETAGKGLPPLKTSVPLVFIRAPRIIATGKAVKVLATYQNDPVFVQQIKIMVATFHPELHADRTVYEYWLNHV